MCAEFIQIYLYLKYLIVDTHDMALDKPEDKPEFHYTDKCKQHYRKCEIRAISKWKNIIALNASSPLSLNAVTALL